MELTAGVREKNSRLQLFLMSLVTKCTLVSNYVVFNGGKGGMCSPNCPERSTCADMDNSEGNSVRPVRSLGYLGK